MSKYNVGLHLWCRIFFL